MGVDGLLINFAILNDMGQLPLYDLSLCSWIDTRHKKEPMQESILIRTTLALTSVS